MKLLFKIITFPFWFPMWLYALSIKLAFFAIISAAVGGYLWYTYG